MKEEIKKIEGYNHYFVSNTGEIFSNKRGVMKKLKGNICFDGYHTVCLEKKTCRVHRLVASAFIPNPENKPQVNHIDGNKLNNSINNLEWATNSENQLHAYKHGLQPKDRKILRGGEVSGSKLTEQDVIDLRSSFDYTSSFFVKNGEKFGVHRSAIENAVLGRRWAHLPGAITDWKQENYCKKNSSFTEEIVKDILRQFANGELKPADYARKLGVHPSTISKVVKRITWKHVKL